MGQGEWDHGAQVAVVEGFGHRDWAGYRGERLRSAQLDRERPAVEPRSAGHQGAWGDRDGESVAPGGGAYAGDNSGRKGRCIVRLQSDDRARPRRGGALCPLLIAAPRILSRALLSEGAQWLHTAHHKAKRAAGEGPADRPDRAEHQIASIWTQDRAQAVPGGGEAVQETDHPGDDGGSSRLERGAGRARQPPRGEHPEPYSRANRSTRIPYQRLRSW